MTQQMSINQTTEEFIERVSVHSEKTGLTYHTGLNHLFAFLEREYKLSTGDQAMTITGEMMLRYPI